tara:strand:+ start:648 stop:1037 length:390 start_codon:yes stop_codon:yes gene_type:complete
MANNEEAKPAEDDVITTAPTGESTLEHYVRLAAAGKLDPMGLEILKGLRERAAMSAFEQPRESHLLEDLSPALADMPEESPVPPYSGLMANPEWRQFQKDILLRNPNWGRESPRDGPPPTPKKKADPEA